MKVEVHNRNDWLRLAERLRWLADHPERLRQIADEAEQVGRGNAEPVSYSRKEKGFLLS